MATSKGPKDKNMSSSPRLTPRPTAASAARAARLATNRNLANQPKQPSSRNIQSPIKAKYPQSPSPSKSPLRRDSLLNKALLQQPLNPDRDEFILDDDGRVTHQRPSETDIEYVVHESATMIIEREVNDNLIINEEYVEDETELQEQSEPKQPAPLAVVADNIEVLPQPRTSTPASSRPQTPRVASRPSTPRAVRRPQTPATSRPQTPAAPVSSRPTTPMVPAHKDSTPPASRPMSPKQTNIRISPSKKARAPSAIPVMTRDHTPTRHGEKDTPTIQETDLMRIYDAKSKHFHSLKKDLDLRQQAVLELYTSIQTIHSQLYQEGAAPPFSQDLEVFNVRSWATEEVSQLCREATPGGAAAAICAYKPFDDTAVAELDAEVIKLPEKFAELCLQAFTARQEIIDWVKEMLQQTEEGGGEAVDRIAQLNAQGLGMCESLRELKSFADNVVKTVTQLSRRAIQERSALLSVGEALVRQVSRLAAELEGQAHALQQLQAALPPPSPLPRDHESQELRAELEGERAASNALKEKLATSEFQLRQTRARITKMDKQIRESEASIAALTGTVKGLEDQNRQREAQMEAKARKLRESVKTGEMTSTNLVQQKKALIAEVEELKETIATLTNQNKVSIQELQRQMKDLERTLEEQTQRTQAELELKLAAENQLLESRKQVEDLSAKMIKIENSKINPELPSEREMELWAELQSTKEVLLVTEDQVVTCKQEKVLFLETLTKIAETENKASMQKKLATELISKEDYIFKMQSNMRELTKAIKFNEQIVAQYKNYVRDYLTHSRSLNNSEDAVGDPTYEDLAQEVLTLRLGLVEAVERNKELNEELTQKLQQLDEQVKSSRSQAKLIKVREELITMLKNKETQQGRELTALQQDLEHRMNIVDEVNQQIAAKADEIQELFTTLESKQQQIHRLEKIVLALEEQQRRAQAQRTRHEEKIAALEHELAGGGRRERKYLFF